MSSSSLLLTVQSPQYGFKFLIKSQLLSLPFLRLTTRKWRREECYSHEKEALKSSRQT